MLKYGVNKYICLYFMVPTIFLQNFRIFFIQLIFMYEVGKCPNTAGVNHSRCCAEILWCLSCLPEMSFFFHWRRLRYHSYIQVPYNQNIFNSDIFLHFANIKRIMLDHLKKSTKIKHIIIHNRSMFSSPSQKHNVRL